MSRSGIANCFRTAHALTLSARVPSGSSCPLQLPLLTVADLMTPSLTACYEAACCCFMSMINQASYRLIWDRFRFIRITIVVAPTGWDCKVDHDSSLEPVAFCSQNCCILPSQLLHSALETVAFCPQNCCILPSELIHSALTTEH